MIHLVTGAPEGSLFLRACRREPVEATPVWFMRQAGRSLPEYRAVRDRFSMVAACTTADVIAELTLQPLRRFAVDAAILFSDIVVPLRAVGLDIDIKPGVGPVTAHPFRSDTDVAQLRDLEPGDVPFITDAVTMLVAELRGTPLIGFAGAPFTLDRKSTRLNSSHRCISYAVFCLKKKKVVNDCSSYRCVHMNEPLILG